MYDGVDTLEALFGHNSHKHMQFLFLAYLDDEFDILTHKEVDANSHSDTSSTFRPLFAYISVAFS